MQDEFPTIPGDRYVIEARLGKGGYGEVYRALQVQIGRPVAIKLLHAHLAERSVIVRRFQREARLLSRLRHPNVVAVHDFHAESGLLYLVMEHLEGPNLREWARTHGPLSVASVVEIMHRIVAGLRAVHEGGLIHRDLKPSNIIMAQIGGSLEPVLIDFGLAATEGSDDDETALTLSEQLLGTPLYMSPEVARGQAASAASDTYAVGIMLHEFIAGQVPFRGRRMMDTLRMHVHLPVPELQSARGETLPPALVELVKSCLAKTPTDRPTIGELSARLGALIPGGPARASTFGLARAALEQAVAHGSGEGAGGPSSARRALDAEALLAEEEPQGRTTILDSGAMHALLRGLLQPPEPGEGSDGSQDDGSTTTILPSPGPAVGGPAVDTQAETVAWDGGAAAHPSVAEDADAPDVPSDEAPTAPRAPRAPAESQAAAVAATGAPDAARPMRPTAGAPARRGPGAGVALAVGAALLALVAAVVVLSSGGSGGAEPGTAPAAVSALEEQAGEAPAGEEPAGEEPAGEEGAGDATGMRGPGPEEGDAIRAAAVTGAPAEALAAVVPAHGSAGVEPSAGGRLGAEEGVRGGAAHDAAQASGAPTEAAEPLEAPVVEGGVASPRAGPSSARDREDRRAREPRRRDAAPPAEVVIDLPEEPGILSVNVSPWGEVWANGQHLGQAPVRDRRVPAGRYVVRTRHGDGEQEEVVEVRPGERAVVLHVYRPGGSDP